MITQMSTFKANMYKSNMITSELNKHGLDLHCGCAVFDTTLPEWMHGYITRIDVKAIPLDFKFTATDNPVIAKYLESGRDELIASSLREQKEARDWHARA